MSTRREPDFLTPPGDDPEEPEVAYTGTATLKRLLLRGAIVSTMLGVGVSVGAVATGAWYGAIAGVMWLICGGLAIRQYRKIRDKEKIRAIHQMRWALVGTILFLIGVALLVFGENLFGQP